MNKNDMNLLLRYREIHKERESQSSPGRIYIAIVLVVALLLGAYSVNRWLTKLSIEKKNEELTNYITSPDVTRKMEEISVLQDNIKALDGMIEQTMSINEVFDSAIRFDSEALNVLQDTRYTGISFDSISYAKGILYVNISGTRASDASNYVLRLSRSGYFKSVSYSGYTYDSTENVYRSTIRCTLVGGDGQ